MRDEPPDPAGGKRLVERPAQRRRYEPAAQDLKRAEVYPPPSVRFPQIPGFIVPYDLRRLFGHRFGKDAEMHERQIKHQSVHERLRPVPDGKQDIEREDRDDDRNRNFQRRNKQVGEGVKLQVNQRVTDRHAQAGAEQIQQPEFFPVEPEEEIQRHGRTDGSGDRRDAFEIPSDIQSLPPPSPCAVRFAHHRRRR